MPTPQAASVILACAVAVAVGASLHPLSDEFIDLINSKQTSWRAGRNFRRDTPLAHIHALMGLRDGDDIAALPTRTHHPDTIAALPDTFDPRDKWPTCTSLNEIRDQGSCGSCWAHATVETMTDRYCIYSNGTKQFHFSAEDLVTCSTNCEAGCYGGNLVPAFKYWIENGITSGGNYNSGEGCRPYSIPECEHHVPGNRPPCGDIPPTPRCVTHCINGYNVTYQEDKRYGLSTYRLEGEDDIKAELFTNGPVAAGFSVFTDFVHYKHGVYQHTDGKLYGSHAIKIIGWGEEGGHKYWLVANSWNTDWGDKGFFKILRGENHCGIEGGVITGEPRLD